MLLGILDLEKVSVEDIMIPCNEIVGIDLEQEWDAILAQLTTSQHTRLPLYHGHMDSVEKIVHVRDVLNRLAEQDLNKDVLYDIAEPVYFVPESTHLHAQLLNFRKEQKRSALVVNEYGDILGLVTLEDILEEIVGEFTTDIAAMSRDIHPQADGSYLIDGSASLRDINRTMLWELPQDGPKTLSGLIIEYLETIPEPGTGMRINGYPIEVVKVKANMVKTARLLPHLRLTHPAET